MLLYLASELRALCKGGTPSHIFYPSPSTSPGTCFFSSCECTAPVLAQSSSRSSGTCTCVACVRRRGIAQDATAMEADSLLKFGYHFECPAGGVGAGVVVGFSLIPLTYELRPYAEDRTPFQFLARQMICVALPSHLSFGPYARGVHPLIFLSTPSTPPGTSVHHTEHGFALIPVEVRASIRHIYVGTCRGTCRRRVV